MSVPISECLIKKAARGEKCALKLLFDRMAYNMQRGIFTVYPCECKPRCEADEDQMDELDRKIVDIYRKRKEFHKANPNLPNAIHISGDYEHHRTQEAWIKWQRTH